MAYLLPLHSLDAMAFSLYLRPLQLSSTLTASSRSEEEGFSEPTPSRACIGDGNGTEEDRVTSLSMSSNLAQSRQARTGWLAPVQNHPAASFAFQLSHDLILAFSEGSNRFLPFFIGAFTPTIISVCFRARSASSMACSRIFSTKYLSIPRPPP